MQYLLNGSVCYPPVFPKILRIKITYTFYGVVMKKIFGLFLLSLSCACTATAVACAKDNPDANKETYTVSFTDGEGFSYVTADGAALSDSADVKDGDTLSFKLDVGAFYAGTPTVLANDTAVSSVDGVYSFTVEENTTVKVNGIVKDVSSMVGTGASDDAFLVTRPIDLVYIAEQVNAGNETYSTASYVLGNDIDCKGEELKIIGDLSTETSFFSGCFACYTDSETGEMQRYTISNFVINSTSSNYVGLFGCVQTNLTTTSSGLIYGIRLDNFTINASTTGMPEGNENALYCGSLIGYGVGANAYLCDATNGELNVFADDRYFAFAGGLIGCQQGYYAQAYGTPFASEIAYATVDVDVVTMKGTSLYAGGVTGFTFTNSLVAPAFIHNAVSTGTVSGAIRAGGISGGLGQYTSVSTSYATGDVVANSEYTLTQFSNDPTYRRAYAGGLVGYAENDTIVNDCFATGDTYAQAAMGADYEYVGAFVAYGDETGTVGVNGQACVQFSNLNSVNKNDNTFGDYKTKLGWREADWTFTVGEYPAVNYETSTEDVVTRITVHYVTKDEGVTVKVSDKTSTYYEYKNGYQTMMDTFNSGYLALYLTADKIANANYMSYGYFFDEECTQPVPYSYLTTRSVDLYVGFADYTKIVGTYYVDGGDEIVELTLTEDGYAKYKDGNVNISVRYQYDGSVILFEGVTFAKFFTGEVDSELSVNEDSAFDMNRYNAYYFEATVSQDGTLYLYDGTYYKKDGENRLCAYKTKPAEPAKTTATSYNGSWYDPWNKATVTLGTLGENGVGSAKVVYSDGTKYDLVYEPSKTAGYYVLYYVYDETVGGVTSTYKTAFGYFRYDSARHSLVTVMTDPYDVNTGYGDFELLTVDKFKGDWMSEDGLFGSIYFNGAGHYNEYLENGEKYEGLLTIGDEIVSYTLDSFSSTGSFTYNGTEYEIFIDGDGKVTIKPLESEDKITMQPTDEFAEYTSFVTFDKNTFEMRYTFTFDGRGYLQNGGTWTINGTDTTVGQTYKILSSGIVLYRNDEEFATIEKNEEYYTLNITGKTEQLALYPTNELMGNWAMSGEFESLEIGPSDLQGNIYARFKGTTVKIEELDTDVLTFSCKLENMPLTYYMFLLYSEKETENGETEEYLSGFALTQYTSLAYNQYTICSPADELFGTWEMTETFEGEEVVKCTISFDGVSFDPTGRYSYGTAYLSYMQADTPYYYIYTAKGNVLLWSQTTLLGSTKYFTLVPCDTDVAGAYVMGENAFLLKAVDALLDTTATDKTNNVTYTFDGGNVNSQAGTVTASNGKTYSYTIDAYDSTTASWTLTFTDKTTKKKYTATMRSADPSNITITLAAQ